MSEKRKVDELFDLTGHVAVITGAGRGIGEGIAVAMSEAGASVVVAASCLLYTSDAADE